jgi:ferric-dicitrate binding protein FerR (iron transport regulator)
VNDPVGRLPTSADEDATTRLLRLAGPRAAVSATRAARVRSAVRGEWEAATRRRGTRRRVALVASIAATAAALLLLVGRTALLERHTAPLGGPVAVIEQVDGSPQRVSSALAERNGTPLHRDDSVRVGEWIETGNQSRVALRFGDGTSVRLDIASRVRPLSPGGIELAAGAVYVDTGRQNGRFEVRTALATAHDIGTQFEVRLADDGLRLRVRTGLVELKGPTRSISGRPGTEILLSADGAVSRPIAIHGSEWDWTTRVSPPVAMEGMSLAAFMERVAHEHGWTLRYASPAVEANAARVILHGPVDGLAPHEMVEVVIATSGLRHRLENGELVVSAGDARGRE